MSECGVLVVACVLRPGVARQLGRALTCARPLRYGSGASVEKFGVSHHGVKRSKDLKASM